MKITKKELKQLIYESVKEVTNNLSNKRDNVRREILRQLKNTDIDSFD